MSTTVRLIEAIGPDAAGVLIDAHGGTDIYLPRRLPADHPLSSLIGFERAARLQAAFGHGALAVPLRPPAVTITARVAGLSAAGHSAAEIARRLGCTVRTVRRHRARSRPSPTEGRPAPSSDL